MDRPEAQTGRRPKKEINYKGESFPTVLELAEHLGIQKDALARRIRAAAEEKVEPLIKLQLEISFTGE